MGADIENPDADGCVAAAEPSPNTFKERLVAAFLGTPNGDARGGDADDKAQPAKLPNGGGGGGGGGDKEATPPNANVGGGDAVAADGAAAKPVKRGWRNYLLYVCCAIFLVVSIASVYPFTQAKDTRHMVLWGVGVFGGFLVAKLSIEIAVLV